MTTSRVPAGVPTGGQFAAAARVESSVALASPVVEVRDSSGEPIEITPGLIDENAEWVYRNGQCLALAVAISEQTGWPIHLRCFTDGDPYDPAGTYLNLRHAYVKRPDGTLLDIRGDHDEDIVEEECRDLDGDLYCPPRLVPHDQARGLLEEFGGYLEHQDVEAARSFVGSVIARPEQQAALRYDSLAEVAAAGYVTDEWSRWQQGDCAAYAIALVDAHEHLRFAVLGETDRGGGDASGGWRETHCFAHDDEYAYDSAGRHPLPYRGIEGTSDYAELDSDPDWYGYRDEFEDDDFAAAREHATRHGLLTRDPVPFGGLSSP